MRVIVIHNADGDTVALVANTAPFIETAFTEIDPEDSKDVLKSNPELQLQLQAIFKDVMSMFGLSAFTPGAANDAS